MIYLIVVLSLYIYTHTLLNKAIAAAGIEILLSDES